VGLNDAATMKFLGELKEWLETTNRRFALVGAIAMAVHGYVRATDDFDFAIATSNPDPFFDSLEDWLSEGFRMTRSASAADDPLGGVATIFGAETAVIQFVNFVNPHTLRNSPGVEAIKAATPEPSLAGIPVAQPEHLLALKLYAGSGVDMIDAVELVKVIESIDWAEVDRVCTKYGLTAELERLRELVGLGEDSMD
jgi:hypothetical protein